MHAACAARCTASHLHTALSTRPGTQRQHTTSTALHCNSARWQRRSSSATLRRRAARGTPHHAVPPEREEREACGNMGDAKRHQQEIANRHGGDAIAFQQARRARCAASMTYSSDALHRRAARTRRCHCPTREYDVPNSKRKLRGQEARDAVAVLGVYAEGVHHARRQRGRASGSGGGGHADDTAWPH